MGKRDTESVDGSGVRRGCPPPNVDGVSSPEKNRISSPHKVHVGFETGSIIISSNN